MLKISVKGINQTISNLKKTFDEINQENAAMAESVVKKNTPIRSGNARRNWNKQVDKQGWELSNRVPYIERLDNGWSKQAPQGITKPSIKEIKRKMK